MRVTLLSAMAIGLVTGFMLPMIIARSTESDIVFLSLAVFNPIVMWLSFDQRKRLLLLDEDDLNMDRSIRLAVFVMLAIIVTLASLYFSSLLMICVGSVKLFSFLVEYEYSVSQRSNNWTSVLLFRLIEFLLVALLYFLDGEIFMLVVSCFLLITLWYFVRGWAITIPMLSDLKERSLPGLQSAATSFISGMPMYMLNMHLFNISITQYAVQSSVLNGFYMLSSLHYSTYSDKVQSFSNRRANLYTLRLFSFHLLLIIIGTLVIYQFEMIDFMFEVEVHFDLFSCFILLFVIMSIWKNLMYTLSYKASMQNKLSKYRIQNLLISTFVLIFVQRLGIYAFFALLLIHFIEASRATKVIYDLHRKL